MNDPSSTHPPLLAIAVLTGLCLLAALAAVAGWISHGPEMFLAMAQNGMSWCF